MRHAFLVGALCAVSACSNVDHDAAERARFLAASVGAITPKALGDGLTLDSVTAEGATLIMAISGLTPEQMAIDGFDAQARAIICQDPNLRDVVSKGVDVRLDMKGSDGPAKTVTVESC